MDSLLIHTELGWDVIGESNIINKNNAQKLE